MSVVSRMLSLELVSILLEMLNDHNIKPIVDDDDVGPTIDCPNSVCNIGGGRNVKQ